MNERQLRLKLEEDYNQNTKNHEEEVQLRLKFESKLNNMHSAHRELESKYKRVLTDFTTEKKTSKLLEDKLQNRQDEIAQLKTQQAENESEILRNREIIGSIQRELNIKNRQMKDMEIRTNKAMEELDSFRFKLQESYKDNTELKLKMDVSISTISGLESEKSHLTLEVNELRELNTMYEEKTKQLMHDLQETTSQLQLNKREMIGFSEVNKEREDKIMKLKQELQMTKLSLDERDLQFNTLTIRYKKTEDTLAEMRKEYDDVVDKLHKVTKARHELET
jgi:chromosome segregation ATPase